MALQRRPGTLVVALALLAVGCSIDIQHDLTEQDANDIYSLLDQHGIPVKKAREEGGNEARYAVSVPKQDASQAIKLLREYSLPRPRAPGLSTFRLNKGMIPTATEERAMYIEALGGEVDNALNKIPGVLESRTLINIPEVNDLTQPDKKPLPTASVLLIYRPPADGKPPLREQDVKGFVATAVPEMRAESVTVILSPAQPPSVELTKESMMQEVLGFKMTQASAKDFKLVVGFAGLAVLGMAIFTTWNFMRQGGGQSRSRRNRHQDA